MTDFIRGAPAGTSIRLRARFKNDLQVPSEANNVFVHVFPPDTEDFDLSNAESVSGVASYLGAGIFEYTYSIPADAEDGIWYDMWQGDLTYQTVSGIFNFEVTASGIVEEVPNQLNINNFVHVVVASGIQALDGSTLTEPYEIEFMTITSPSYSNTRKVRLAIGGFIASLYDDTIQQTILEASLEADAINFQKVYANTDLFIHARREYVTCLASKMLLTNLTAKHMLRSKSLADLSVTYDPTALNNTLAQLDDCLMKWQAQIIAGGGARSSQQPQMVIKGQYDPDRPIVGRIWSSNEEGVISRRYPAANTKIRPWGQRRVVKTYWPTGSGSGW